MYAAEGPNASWEYNAKIAPVVPTFQEMMKLMANAFPTSAPGTKHSSPEKWSDIEALVDRYLDERLTHKDVENPANPVRSVKETEDVLLRGQRAFQEGKFLEDWRERRDLLDKSATDIWEDSSE